MSKKRILGKKIRQFIGAILSLAVMAGAFYEVSAYFARPDSELKYRGFLQSETEFDVLFFGNSHMLNAVFPMQLWEDYGITSYNMAIHGATVKMSYWMIRNAIEYHEPEVIVLDIYSAVWKDHEMDIGYAHDALDVFPLTPTKYQAIKELYTGSDVMEMIFPFSVYHNRWEELFPQQETAEDIDEEDTESEKNQGGENISVGGNDAKEAVKAEENKEDEEETATENLEKGAESRIHVAAAEEYEQIPQDQTATEQTEELEELVRIIDYCQSKEIELVLINIPSPQEVDKQERGNQIQGIADEEGVPYLNLPYENVVNFTTDLFDRNSHLNPSGARKVTDYLGSYLTENYDLADKREDSEYESWNEDYEVYYKQFLIPNLLKEDTLNETLMLLNNENFTADIETTENYPMGNVLKTLLAALQDTITMTDSLAEDQDRMRITIYDASHEEALMIKEFYHDEEGNHLLETIDLQESEEAENE